MKKVMELKPGDVIRFNLCGELTIARVYNTEVYSTWTRLDLQPQNDRAVNGWGFRFKTWLNTDAFVEVLGNDKG